MSISNETRAAMYTAIKKSFQIGREGVKPTYKQISTEITSTTKQNIYPWLGSGPMLRKWVGDRQIKKYENFDYALVNEKYEATIGIDVDDFDDDQLGLYSKQAEDIGGKSEKFFDRLTWEAARKGFTSKCADGQFFFDTDHPKYDEDGKEIGSVSNLQAGAGRPWMLLNDSEVMKPFITQVRQKPDRVVAKDKEDDSLVFMKDQIVYGVKGRGAAGYGIWNMAYASKDVLNTANLKAARLAMQMMTDDRGEPLENRPRLLVVNVQDEDAANELILQEKLAGGASNPLFKAFTILPTPFFY